MRKQSVRLPNIAVLSAALVTLCATGPVVAESACKGLEEAMCTGKADCT